MAVLRFVLLFVAWGGCAFAEQTPIIEFGTRGQNAGALFALDTGKRAHTSGSLFSGQGQKISLLAPYKARRDRKPRMVLGITQVSQLRALIGQAESRRNGYDAIQHGAKRLPGRVPTSMSLGDIFAWIKATPGQPHAIGRYQFIPKTLSRVVKIVGVGKNEVFTPALQDRLADVLLAEAGLQGLRDGQMPRREFMKNLAKTWAGLPTDNGKSYYHGYAGNKASMTWAHFDTEMAKIFPS